MVGTALGVLSDAAADRFAAAEHLSYGSVPANPHRVGDEARFACFAGALPAAGLPFDRDPAERGDGVCRPRYTLNDFRLLAKPSAASFVADTERSLLRRPGGQMLSCREAVCCSIGQHSEHCPNPCLTHSHERGRSPSQSGAS